MTKTYVYTDYGGPEAQKFMDLPKPVPGEGELLVRVHAAGVNPHDWKVRANIGRYFSPDPVRAPRPMGLEVSGVVEALGMATEGFSIGDEVFGLGASPWSEYSLVRVGRATHKPASVSFVDAATLAVAAATAYDGIRQLDLEPGETLLIVGIGGGVGIAAAQIALAEGARVIGTASPSKKSLVERVGAIHVTYGNGVADRVCAAAPQGIAAIYDMVGDDALRAVGGLVRGAARVITAAEEAAAVEFGGSRVKRTLNATTLEAVADLAAIDALKPFVTATFPLGQAAEALALVESGHATGKVVLEIS